MDLFFVVNGVLMVKSLLLAQVTVMLTLEIITQFLKEKFGMDIISENFIQVLQL